MYIDKPIHEISSDCGHWCTYSCRYLEPRRHPRHPINVRVAFDFDYRFTQHGDATVVRDSQERRLNYHLNVT